MKKIEVKKIFTVALVFLLSIQTSSASIGSIYSDTTSSYVTSGTANLNNHNSTGDGFVQDLGNGLEGIVSSLTYHITQKGGDTRMYFLLRHCDDQNYSKNCMNSFEEHFTIATTTAPYTYNIGSGSFQEHYNVASTTSSFSFLPSKYYYAFFADNTSNSGTRIQTSSLIDTYKKGNCIRNCGSSKDVSFKFNGSVSNRVITSNISTTTTWSDEAPYLISGNVEIESGVILTINPGVVVKFDTATSSSLIVKGTLVVDGDSSSGDRIFFTSFKDDSVPAEGDTNSDNNASSPGLGDWGGIVVESGGEATFDWATLRYGGASSSNNAIVYNNGGEVLLENSTIAHSAYYGVKNNSGTTTILSTDIGVNYYGLYLSGGALSIGATSTIHNNSLYGIYNNTLNNLIAANNWWGTSTGPYHPINNVTGAGDAVSDNVTFSSWISSLNYLIDPDCHNTDNCGSTLENGTLRWKWDPSSVSIYTTEVAAAIQTWNDQNNVNIISATSTAEIALMATSTDDVAWSGTWSGLEGRIYLNEYYLAEDTSARRQNTITHEFGHALGLHHSFTGNVMYFNQTSLTELGDQDVIDLHTLWP